MDNAKLHRIASLLVEFEQGVRKATTGPQVKLAKGKLTAFAEGAHIALQALEAHISPAPFGLELDVQTAVTEANERFPLSAHTYAVWKADAVSHLVLAWTPSEDDVKLREHFAALKASQAVEAFRAQTSRIG